MICRVGFYAFIDKNFDQIKNLDEFSVLGDNMSPSTSKVNVRRGDTALLVGSIVLLFTVFTVGIIVLISRKQRRGNEDNEYHSLMTK